MRFFFYIALPLAVFSPPAFAASDIPLTINLSEAVAVTGTPRVAVDVGGQTRYATFTSGSGTSALTFTLSPQAGDVDLDGIAVSSPIDLNGGTIKDLAGNNLAALTFTPPNTSGIKVNYPSLGMDFTYDADGRYTLNGTAYNDLTSFLAASGGTFTRASIGTYYDSTGTLQTATSGAPRFDWDPVTHAAKGLLIEENRTNIVKYSQDFSNVIWGANNVTLTPATISGPDGTLSGGTVTVVTATGSSSIYQAIPAATSYVYSIWLKAKTTASATIGLYDTTGTTWGQPSSGSVSGILSGPGTLTPYIAGSALWTVNGLSTTQWTHVYLTRTTSSNRIYVYPNPAAQVSGDSVYVWGAQVETGTFPTSYIPTTSAAVTRVADALKFSTGAWFNASEGSIFANTDTSNVAAGSQPAIFSFDDTTSNNRIQLRRNNGANTLTHVLAAGGSILSVASGATSWSDTNLHKTSFGYKSALNKTYFDGVLQSSYLTASVMPSITQLQIGMGANATNIDGHIQMLRYYPARVADAQLQLLTQ